MFQQHGDLERRVQENIQQVWGNQEELKGGMDAAEFNLRAHQKVLNSLAIEFERLVRHLNEEIFRSEHAVEVLELTDVTLPADDGEAAQVVRRLDWPYYHRQVEDDLRIIAEIEAKKVEEEAAKPDDPSETLGSMTHEEAELLPPQDDFPAGASVFGG